MEWKWVTVFTDKAHRKDCQSKRFGTEGVLGKWVVTCKKHYEKVNFEYHSA